MHIGSIIAIYALFWVMCAFLILPFGIVAHNETDDEKIPGQADSAPVNFRPGKVAFRATILATILCAAFVANYDHGWVTLNDINFAGHPPGYEHYRDKAG